MDKLSTFELWQVVNMTAQSLLLLAAFLGALYVGIKQWQINKQLVELQQQPTVEVVATEEQFHIYNKGNNSIWLWGIRSMIGHRVMEPEPHLITPHDFHSVPLRNLKSEALRKLSPVGIQTGRLSLFISVANKRKYVVRNVVRCAVHAGKVDIQCQTVGIELEDWTASK